MADKSFGVKDVNLIGVSGTPTIESPNNININAVNVAISTDVSIGQTVSIGGSMFFVDDRKLNFGGGNDLQISHIADFSSQLDNAGNTITDNSASLVEDAGPGPLVFKSNSGTGYGAFQFFDQSWNPMLKIHSQGRVGLYYADQGEKLKTTTDGIIVGSATTGVGIGTDGTLNVTGIASAGSFETNTTTGDGSDRGFTTKYYITANGASAFRFAGPGSLNTDDNPTLYFHRGFTYILENSTGSSHPIELR